MRIALLGRLVPHRSRQLRHWSQLITRTITLHVSNPDGTVGKIDGFRFFWAYYVDGYDPKQHCQMCFKGAPIPEFNTATARTGTTVLFDRMDRHRYLYVCGVGLGDHDQLFRKNFHLPLSYREGSSVSAVTYNGYTVTAHNAVLLQIPALPKDWKPLPDGPALPDVMTRCKNFQFAVEYFGYPGVTRD